jgi:hypothetical protein
MQGKYRTGIKPKMENKDDILKLANLGIFLKIYDNERFNEFVKDANPTVKEDLKKIRRLIKNENYKLNLYYVTTGEIRVNHQIEASNLIEDIENVEVNFSTRTHLKNLMRDYVEGASPPVPTINIRIMNSLLFNRHDNDTEITSWVFTMLGDDLGRLYSDVGPRLFARNIRGYLGQTDINRGIEYTIRKEPYYFWYFNNGVTIICDSAKEIKERGYTTLKISNAQ